MKRLVVLVFLLLFFLSAQSFAHKISAFVDVEDGNVSIVSYFSDGTPAKNAKVTVYDATGRVVLTGKTNREGEFDFNLKKPGSYRAVVLAELGHRATVDFTVGSTGVERGAEKQKPASREESIKQRRAPADEETIRQVLREELRPIHRELLKLEERENSISYKDVIGGLGWIAGIFGAFMFGYCFRGRNRGNAP